MTPEDYFIVEELFPDFKILKPRNNQNPATFKLLREENIASKRLVNHGMPMTYEEKTMIVWDYKNGDLDLPSLEAYLQRSYISILHILELEGVAVLEREIELAKEVIKERRLKEGVDISMYEPAVAISIDEPVLNPSDLSTLDDFKKWHPLYELVLKEIIELREITTQEELESLLNSLAADDQQLSHSYQNDNIDIIYDIENKELAYLLRYTTVYADDLVRIFKKLKQLKKVLTLNKELNLTFIGPGPGFEVMALINMMIKQSILLTNQSTNFNLIDKSHWKIGRNIIKKEIKKTLLIEGLTNKVEINEDFNDFMHLADDNLAKSNVLIFQNCLNEILTVHKSELLIRKIKTYLRDSPRDSCLIFIDRNKYKSIESFFDEVELIPSELKDAFNVYRSKETYSPITLNQVPDILKNTIYIGALSATRKIHSSYLVLRKVDC